MTGEVVLRERTPGERAAYYDGQLSRLAAQVSGLEEDLKRLRGLMQIARTFREIACEAKPAKQAKVALRSGPQTRRGRSGVAAARKQKGDRR